MQPTSEPTPGDRAAAVTTDVNADAGPDVTAPHEPIVYVVDDDPGVRRALSRLFRARGLEARCFDSAAAFLEAPRPVRPSCLVLDVRMPDMGGLALQARLTGDGSAGADTHPHPIVFLSGHADVPTTVRAMKRGAIDFLEKPVDEGDLVGAVQEALTRDADRLRTREAAESTERRMASLTPRERQVMRLVARGLRNRDIGDELGISEGTVKVHRGRVMKKLELDSVADLVRLLGSGT